MLELKTVLDNFFQFFTKFVQFGCASHFALEVPNLKIKLLVIVFERLLFALLILAQHRNEFLTKVTHHGLIRLFHLVVKLHEQVEKFFIVLGLEAIFVVLVI